ncbi:MAG: hypothetical protein HY788_14640 [Deltaproteobacteria bacterium]|nr:hypothetical protein [Deltaproteobacteria bacterium]
MSLILVARMSMIVRPVLAGMLMPVIVVFPFVRVLVPAVVLVIMGVELLVFVAVLLALVLVFMIVLMRMIMPVALCESMFSFHFPSPFRLSICRRKRDDFS